MAKAISIIVLASLLVGLSSAAMAQCVTRPMKCWWHFDRSEGRYVRICIPVCP